VYCRKFAYPVRSAKKARSSSKVNSAASDEAYSHNFSVLRSSPRPFHFTATCSTDKLSVLTYEQKRSADVSERSEANDIFGGGDTHRGEVENMDIGYDYYGDFDAGNVNYGDPSSEGTTMLDSHIHTP